MSDGSRGQEALRVVTSCLRVILDERDEGEREPISALTPLYSSGAAHEWGLDLDSLEALDLITMLEESYGMTLTTEVHLDKLRSVGDIAAAIASFPVQMGGSSNLLDGSA